MQNKYKNRIISSCVTVLILFISGCSSTSGNFIANGGASTKEVQDVNDSRIKIVNITLEEANKVASTQLMDNLLFANKFKSEVTKDYTVGSGDILEIIVWEAAPATLFSSSAPSTQLLQSGQTTTIPQQVVSADGTIIVPFAGVIKVSGLTLNHISSIITAKLKGKANNPQVMVQSIKRASSTVSMVGDFVAPSIFNITPKGERILDAIAMCGGSKQPIGKTTIQMTRNGKTEMLPLDSIIRYQENNVKLQAGDVLTALYQPYSITVLGATGKNDEIPFEGMGITLAQALGRSGGINANRADSSGVFIFRNNGDDNAPTIYRANMSDPATYFAATKFPMKNGDILYISDASSVQLQKFLGIVTQMLYTVATPKSIGLVK